MNQETRVELIRLLSGSAMIFGCRVLGAASVFVTQVLLARWMGAEQLGYYVYAFAWSLLLGTVATVGFPASSFRIIGHALALGQEGRIRGFVRRGTQIIVIGSVLACLAGFGFLALGGRTAGGLHLAVFVPALLMIPVFALMRWQSSIAYGHAWMVLAVAPENLLRPLILLVVVAAWYMVATLDAPTVMYLNLAVTLLITAALAWVVSAKRRMRIPEPPPPQYAHGEWFRYALPLLIIVIFSNYFMELNLIVEFQSRKDHKKGGLQTEPALCLQFRLPDLYFLI